MHVVSIYTLLFWFSYLHNILSTSIKNRIEKLGYFWNTNFVIFVLYLMKMNSLLMWIFVLQCKLYMEMTMKNEKKIQTLSRNILVQLLRGKDVFSLWKILYNYFVSETSNNHHGFSFISLQIYILNHHRCIMPIWICQLISKIDHSFSEINSH